jgi:hypothetical protein
MQQLLMTAAMKKVGVSVEDVSFSPVFLPTA